MAYGREETIEKRIEAIEKEIYQAAAVLQFFEADQLKEPLKRLRKQNKNGDL